MESKIVFKGDPSQANRAIADVQRNMDKMTQHARKMGDTIKGATRPDSIADMTKFLDKLGQQAQTTSGKIGTISSLAASFGGPWGIAIAGVAAGVVALADKFDLFGEKAAEASRKAQEEMENLRKKTAEDFGSSVVKSMSIESALKEIKGNEFKQRISDASKELYDIQQKKLRYEGTEKGEQYAREEKYKIEYIQAQIDAYNELFKVEEKIVEKERAISKERMSKLQSKTGLTPDLGGQMASVSIPKGASRLDELMRIDPTTLDSISLFNEYIRQMNEELNRLEINSDAYNVVSEKIQSAKDKQTELLGGTKQQVDYGAELASAFGSASNSLSVFADESRNAAAAQKALAIAEQLAAMASAIHTASKGDPYTVAARIIAASGAIVAAFASMSSAKFAAGGIVSGSHYAGDSQLVRVNSGEMILNSSQQNKLWNVLSNGNLGGDSSREISFRLRGTDIEGVMHNTQKIQNRMK